MTLVDFEMARREKQIEKREMQVEKYVLLCDYKLFDSWIEQEQAELTEQRLSAAKKQVEFMESLGINYKEVFEDVIYYDPDDFTVDYKLDWLDCLEAALVFYAYNRKYNYAFYELEIIAHRFVGPLSTP